jgi:geranylgeranyl diphosphate synthase type II
MFEKYINNELNVYYSKINNSKIRSILQYSLEGGKCIRGFIVKHIMEKIGKKIIWQPIASIELIHGISLIIDDLPCMDNDLIRRNKPSTFVKFGEKESILVSFYGISEAFKILFEGINNNKDIFPEDIYNKVQELLEYWNEEIGKNLIIGQMLDLCMDVEELLNINIAKDKKNIMLYKTASLFSFSFILGGIFSSIDNIIDFKKMGYLFGIMFQLMDDYKDMDTDENSANYFLQNGKKESIELYLNCKLQLLNLLEKYNLYTEEFKMLINKIDETINI